MRRAVDIISDQAFAKDRRASHRDQRQERSKYAEVKESGQRQKHRPIDEVSKSRHERYKDHGRQKSARKADEPERVGRGRGVDDADRVARRGTEEPEKLGRRTSVRKPDADQSEQRRSSSKKAAEDSQVQAAVQQLSLQPVVNRMTPVPEAAQVSWDYLPESTQRTIAEFKAFMATDAYTNPSDPTPINNYLYLGRVTAALDVQGLLSLGITHVLNMAPVDTARIPQYKALVPRTFVYKEINTLDDVGYDMTAALEEAHEYIESVRRANGRILVHCLAGINRSGFVVLGHLILRGFKLVNICQKIKKRRAAFVKNVGFQEQLINLALARGVLISSVPEAYHAS